MLYQNELHPDKSKALKSIVSTQDVISIQILIELLLLVDNEVADKAVVFQIRTNINNYLHHVFCNDPSLIETIHFETYPIDAIPIVIKGVPSLHKCSEFLNSLLQNRELPYNKLLFAFNLCAAIAEEYPLSSNYLLCKSAINRFKDICNCSQLSENEKAIEFKLSKHDFIYYVLPSLLKIAKAFNQLAINLIDTISNFIGIFKNNNNNYLLSSRIHKVPTDILIQELQSTLKKSSKLLKDIK